MDDNAIDLKKLGYKIRFLRQGKEWTLADLAGRSGIAKAYISDLENGVAGKPNIQYMFAVATALGVTLDELISDTTSKPLKSKRLPPTTLPPGLLELQQELKLTNEDVETLAQVNFRGNRPRDKEGWRFLLEALKMVGRRTPQK